MDIKSTKADIEKAEADIRNQKVDIDCAEANIESTKADIENVKGATDGGTIELLCMSTGIYGKGKEEAPYSKEYDASCFSFLQ